MGCSMFLYLVVILASFFRRSVLDSVSWNLHSKPAIFGKSVNLLCHLPKDICCHRYTRRWLGGHGLPLLTMNGVSTNPHKYSEKLNEENFTSVLTIYLFEPSDVNIPYECTYGFGKDVKMLKLNQQVFEAFKPEMVKANITTNQNIVAGSISMKDVYPSPNCTAAINLRDISDELFLLSYSSGIFYHSFINISYKLKSDDCNGQLNITCNIGSRVFEKYLIVNCSKLHKSNSSEFLEVRNAVIAVIAFVLMGLAFVIALLKLKVLYRCCKSKRKNRDQRQHKEKTTENTVNLLER